VSCMDGVMNQCARVQTRLFQKVFHFLGNWNRVLADGSSREQFKTCSAESPI
jgi:hypothetical protein